MIRSINGQAMNSGDDVHEMLIRCYRSREPVVIRTDPHREVHLPAVAVSQRSLAVHPTPSLQHGGRAGAIGAGDGLRSLPPTQR